MLQLLPDAPQHVIDQANRVWEAVPNLPAVENGRVYMLTQWYVQQSGYHVGDLAGLFAERLHPEVRQTQPARGKP